MTEVREVRDNAARSRYELLVDGEVVAFVLYTMRGGRLMLVHTEVDDALSRRGLATALIEGTLKDVRRRGLLVVPTCPFVERYIERHPEDDDLVDHEIFNAINAKRR